MINYYSLAIALGESMLIIRSFHKFKHQWYWTRYSSEVFPFVNSQDFLSPAAHASLLEANLSLICTLHNSYYYWQNDQQWAERRVDVLAYRSRKYYQFNSILTVRIIKAYNINISNEQASNVGMLISEAICRTSCVLTLTIWLYVLW